jgi:diguanylate cyclase (GGDEF)-like protein/PAS domain S-box-containing protein
MGPADADATARLERLETIFRLAPLGVGIVDMAGRTVMANETLRLLLGYSADEFASMSWVDYTHPDDVARNVELFEHMHAGEIDDFSMEKRFIRKDGSALWVDLTSSVVRDAAGEPLYLVGMVQDISEHKRLERELRTAEQHYRLMVERVPAVVYVADAGAEATWHYVSPQIEEMLGFTPTEWRADPRLWLQQIHPDDRDGPLAEEERVLRSDAPTETHSTSYRIRHRDGRIVWIRDDAVALRHPDGGITWHGVLVDVTREKQLEDRLGHQALHDPLTGLPNRRLFHDRVEDALGRAGLDGSVTVLFVDLDHFKTVNDSFGHGYGDKVISTAARRIRACVRSADTAARLGGDEFALLIEDASGAEAEALADRLLETLRRRPMRLGDLTVTVAASVGIATAGPGETADALLRNADLAMYRAKRQGRGRWYRYHDGLHDEVVNRFRMEEALQAAVAAEQVSVAYQPIVELATGAVVGLEALARWTDPVLGVVAPDRFIAVAERTGLIRELGQQVLRRACAGLVAWRQARGVDAYVSVNVSPLQLDGDFAGAVARVLEDTGLEPSALVLEVTEGVLLEQSGRDAISGLRAGGVRVAIDDFGTGYSSMIYLREVPVDILKIDQMFLRPGASPAQDDAVLRALVGLAGSLRLTTICEGVETADQLADLRAAGCGHAQGYLFARPGDLADIPSRIDLDAHRVLPLRS